MSYIPGLHCVIHPRTALWHTSQDCKMPYIQGLQDAIHPRSALSLWMILSLRRSNNLPLAFIFIDLPYA